ncbi:MAG: FtsX-like permease family protein [Gemmatimonadales bacterium]
MSQDAKVASWLAVVAAIVLLIACANVANILLARAVQRQREIAIRRAMGAGQRDLARQLLTESVLLALAGAGGAVLVALWTGPVVRAFLLRDVPAAATAVDERVLLFTAAIALFVGVLTGLAPALQVGREDLTHALKSGAGEGRFQRSKLRSLLLVGQVALTLALLVGAGLFARSLRSVVKIDLGFEPERVLTATMDLAAAGVSRADANALYLRMLERVQAVPGVEHAAAAVGSPFGWSHAMRVSEPGRDSLPRLKSGGPYYQAVTADYFRTMGTPLLRGRGFTPADRAGAPGVVVINETFARLVWPGEDPVGKCVRLGSSRECREIVGVVPAAKRFAVIEEVTMHLYLPLPQSDFSAPISALLVRPVGRPDDMVAAVQREMQGVQSNLPFARVVPLADLAAPSIRPWRLGTAMFGLFALLALVLSAVGLYGVLAYTVGQRTHELGVRIALGAQQDDVLRLVVGQGVRMAGLGIAVGAIVALLGGRAVASLLYGVSPHDPTVLSVAGGVLLAVAVLASYLPARRATKVDPMVALRTE